MHKHPQCLLVPKIMSQFLIPHGQFDHKMSENNNVLAQRCQIVVRKAKNRYYDNCRNCCSTVHSSDMSAYGGKVVTTASQCEPTYKAIFV